MTRTLGNGLALLSVLLLSGISTAQADNTAFDLMVEHYDAIRLQLLDDSTLGVAEHAVEIANVAGRLSDRFDPVQAAVEPASRADCLRLLVDIKTGASELAEATQLEETREQFGVLSAPMVHYYEMTGRKDRVVVFCPMLKQVWLQPSGEIGNPYYGTSMPRCGEIVSK